MARLVNSGFELNTPTSGVENSSVTNATGQVQGTTFRSGSYAQQITSLSSGGRKNHIYALNSSSGQNGPYFFRYYFQVATAPSAENRIFAVSNASSLLTPMVYITIDNGRLLRLYDEDGVVGSPTSALTTNTWYRVEVKYDRTPAAGSQIVEAYLDGVQFAASATSNLSAGVQYFGTGGNLNSEAQTTGNWFFDDLAANDSTGSFQTSFPGSAQIIHLRPSAVGDANAWTRGGTDSGANWSQTSEVTPDDIGTYNTSTTLNQEDLFNVDSPTSLGSGDTVNVVSVGVRYRSDNAASNPSFRLEIEASSGGTIEQSAAITPASTVWLTNNNNGNLPAVNPLILYDLPGASTTAWTKADLETAQIGYKITADSTNNVQISTLWLMVDYTTGGGGGGTVTRGNLLLLGVG